MRSRLLLAAVAAGTLVLGACSGDHSGMDMGDGDSMPMDSTAAPKIAADEPFNGTDVSFAQGMIPHHAQAIEMAEMALAISDNADVIALAEQIKAAQGPEIAQMTTWLSDWGQTVPDRDASMDESMNNSGGMMMSGMMSADDMARMGNATGTDFDRVFLEMMIIHHEGAIEMAEQLVADGEFAPTKELANAILTGQQAEIDEMKALIAGLPG